MKLIVLKNNLKSGLEAVSRAIGSNSNLPIISNVLIKTVDNKVKIIATNLEIAVGATISGKVIEDGSLSVPHDVLLSIVNNLSSERINLEAKNNNLAITTDNYEALIQGIAENEYPIIPKIKDEKEYVEINGSELQEALNKVIIAAGSNELRPEINGVLMVVESSVVKLAATDSFRLAEAKIGEGHFKNHLSEGFRVIIPLKTAEILSKMQNSDGDISIYFENNQILVRTEGVEMISRLIEGKFPDYEAIVPKSIASEALISRDEFINALKLANSFALRVKDVKIRSKDKKVLEVFSSDTSLGENKYLIPGKISGEGFETTFNLKYLLDGVRAEESETIYLGVNEDNKPAFLKTPNNQNYFYILMPVKV